MLKAPKEKEEKHPKDTKRPRKGPSHHKTTLRLTSLISPSRMRRSSAVRPLDYEENSKKEEKKERKKQKKVAPKRPETPPYLKLLHYLTRKSQELTREKGRSYENKNGRNQGGSSLVGFTHLRHNSLWLPLQCAKAIWTCEFPAVGLTPAVDSEFFKKW